MSTLAVLDALRHANEFPGKSVNRYWLHESWHSVMRFLKIPDLCRTEAWCIYREAFFLALREVEANHEADEKACETVEP